MKFIFTVIFTFRVFDNAGSYDDQLHRCSGLFIDLVLSFMYRLRLFHDVIEFVCLSVDIFPV